MYRSSFQTTLPSSKVQVVSKYPPRKRRRLGLGATKLGGAGRSAGTQGQLNNGRATAPVASTLNLQPETLLWADRRLPPPLSPLPSPSFSSNPDSLCLLHPPSPRFPGVNWRDISWFVIAFWRKASALPLLVTCSVISRTKPVARRSTSGRHLLLAVRHLPG